jgi:glutathionyl-hydroquinone reductase
MRKLKGLEDMISMSVVNSLMGPGGWTFDAGPGVIPDDINHTNRLYEIYTKAAPTCSSRVTVPVLLGYTKDLYQVPGIAETVDIDHIKAHYYASHTHINPTAVVPQGPKLDYSTPHGRENTGNLAV